MQRVGKGTTKNAYMQTNQKFFLFLVVLGCFREIKTNSVQN